MAGKDRKRTKKEHLLEDMGLELAAAAYGGFLTPEFPISIEIPRIVRVAGPRVGALELHCDLEAGRVLSALSKNNCAMLRQFIKWDFPGHPACYMSGKAVRVEAPWPPHLEEKDVRLSQVNRHPFTVAEKTAKGQKYTSKGRWVIGQSEAGRTVTVGLNNIMPTVLVGGTPGSGKSTFFQVLAAQLAAFPKWHQLVLVDGKYGDGLHPISSLPGLAGPLADTLDKARDALGWVTREMRRRYREYPTELARHQAELPLIVVLVDEFHEFTIGGMADKAIAEMLRMIAQQGRGALIHIVLGTHHPTQDMFGNKTTKRLLVGRVAFNVVDQDASRVLLGRSDPKAHLLRDVGDAYVITPRGQTRIQAVWIPPEEMDLLPVGEPTMEEYPPYDPSVFEHGGALEEQGKKAQWSYGGAELAIGLVQAHLGKDGRPALIKALKGCGFSAGSNRASRLQALSREQNEFLLDGGWGLCRLDGQTPPPPEKKAPEPEIEVDDLYWSGIQYGTSD